LGFVTLGENLQGNEIKKAPIKVLSICGVVGVYCCLLVVRLKSF
jgi:hypothetical protein